MSEKIILTICIPTYNRPNITLNLINNLPKSPFVEYLVIDDGSKKEDFDYLKKGILLEEFKIRLFQKKNGGKLSAVRYGLKFAKGKYYMDLDSDDWFIPEYLENILKALNQAEQLNKEGNTIIGIAGLCVNKSKQVEGNSFPKGFLLSNYFQMRADHAIKGNKEEVVLTKALKTLEIEWYKDEIPMTPAIQWLLLGNKEWLFVNKTFSQKNIIETERITDSWQSYIFDNKNTVRRNFKQFILNKHHYNNTLFFLKAIIQYIRFGLHGARPFLEQEVWSKHPSKIIFSIPISFFVFIRDIIRLQNSKKSRKNEKLS